MESLNCLSDECISLLIRNQLLDSLIGSEFVKDKLESISLDKKIENDRIDNFMKELKIPENGLKEWCSEKGITESHFKVVALKELKQKEFVKKEFGAKADSHFLERKNDLDTAVYSLIRKKSVFEARELYLRISENEAEFSELALKYSEGVEKNTLGRIGPVAIGQSHPILAELIRMSKPGEIHPPVDIEGYYIILRVESYTPAKLDAHMREKMSEELFSSWVRSNVIQLRKALLKRTQAHSNDI